MTALLDYLILLRPTLLIPVWTLMLIGYYRALPSPSIFIFRPDPKLIISLFAYSLLAGSSYIVNQLTDRKTDQTNDKLYLIADGYVKIPIAIFEAIILTIFGLSIAFWQFSENRSFLILIVVSVLIGLAYSVPPIRLKSRPILDLIANSIGYGGIAFCVGWTSIESFSISAILRSLPYVGCVSAAFVNTTLPDISGDRLSGTITTGVWIGKKRSCRLSLILLILSGIASILLKDWIALITVIISSPFFVKMNLDLKTETIIRATRIGILSLSLTMCIIIPLYSILLFVMIFIVRWYYKNRFGLKYP